VPQIPVSLGAKCDAAGSHGNTIADLGSSSLLTWLGRTMIVTLGLADALENNQNDTL
jgi:hypothetical protein